jgi:hypothetical protein
VIQCEPLGSDDPHCYRATGVTPKQAPYIRKLDATPVFREVLGPALTSFISQLPYSRMRYNLLRATVLQALTTCQ